MSDAAAAMMNRARAYELVGELLVDGLRSGRLDEVRAVPSLAEHLPEGLEPEQLAAAHYELFGLEVFPFASVFLDERGLVGTAAATERLRTAHLAAGLACPEEPSVDHLGQGLRLLGALSTAELEARRRGDHEDARALLGWQRRVLDEALLPWAPPLYAAVIAQPASLWSRTVELAVGLMARHRDGDPGLPQVVDHGEADAPRAEVLLDNPRTGLSTVATFLCMPAQSGVYLARRDLAVIGRHCTMPRGFGRRRDTLERLLRSAAEYGALPEVLVELAELLAARDDTYASLAAEPGLCVHVPAWRRRLAGTQRLLERLRDAARRIGKDPPRSAPLAHP